MRSLVLLVGCGMLVSCQSHPWSAASSIVPDRDHAGAAAPAGNISPQGTVQSYADTVDRVAPAVVTVRSARRVKAGGQFPFLGDEFFRRFFGEPGQRNFGAPRDEVEHALGSGVIVRSDGYILTNHHVVDGAEEMSVDLGDRRTFKAKLTGSDAPSDLAVLKIEATNLPVLTPGDSDKVRVGDICLAVGNPLGLGQTVTAGIISAKGRRTDLSDGSFEDFLQTDAPINRGNSGGALVNTRGELIGINSQIVSSTGESIGIGFAIPSNMATSVMNQLITKGKVSRGQLGVTIQYINSDLAASLGMKEVRGVLVNQVSRGGAAERAGLKSGDVILAMNGTPINDVNTMRNRVAAAGPGAQVTLQILRDGKPLDMHATLDEFKPEANRSGRAPGGGAPAPGQLGLSVEPLTPDLAERLGLPRTAQGLVADRVAPGSAASEAGIQEGDVIQEVNRQPVRSAEELRAALQKSGDRPALVRVNRQGRTIFLPVRVH